MLLTITATRNDGLADASDLGYLLHKHPDRVQTFEVFGGTATVAYPEVTVERCTVALVPEYRLRESNPHNCSSPGARHTACAAGVSFWVGQGRLRSVDATC